MKAPTLILGTQYFRPPFPRQSCWADDIKAMKQAGLNAVQLWLVWGWCEPSPGKFVFDDYDRLCDLAEKEGLGMVLSTLPEINPQWLARVQPEGMMVDIEGRPVLSCARWETLSGQVPGACSDHPEIRKRMVKFLEECGRHFSPRGNLLAWDCWNENRWRNMAPEVVCFCAASLAAQRAFLNEKYGGLKGLGEAWGRRYESWEDVHIGRLYSYCYPEWHDYTLWLCRRAQEMAGWRTDALRRSDPRHPVSNHTGNPSIFGGVNINENIFSRGVDWDIAAGETYGFSSFPKSSRIPMAPEDFCMRTSAVTTCGGGKPIWMSELQGGTTTSARAWGPLVTGAEQQAWVWTGISRGVSAVIFWAWRPEIFGVESGGHAMNTDDGAAEDRQSALRRTSQVIARKSRVLARYQPDPAEVAVLFQRSSYFLGWMHQKFFNFPANDTPKDLEAYLYALERLNVHYAVHDDRHLPEDPGALKCVIVPDPLGLDDRAAAWLIRFARRGGTVFVEAGAGMHGSDTFYRGPNERPLYKAAGLEEDLCRAVTLDRRTVPAGTMGNDEAFDILLDKIECTFRAGRKGVILLPPDGLPLLANRALGKGRIIALGSVVGRRMRAEAYPALETLVRGILATAGVVRPIACEAPGPGLLTWRLGRAPGKRLLILCNYGGAREAALTLSAKNLSPKQRVADWFGHALDVTRDGSATRIRLDLAEYDHAVLEWACPPEAR